jgi:predicted DNA-binding transcriptional regulator AlpA
LFKDGQKDLLMAQELRALESRIEELEIRLNNPRMMTPIQVCGFLQISERALYDMKERGDAPPAIYFSQRTVRYDLHEVMAWAKQKEVGHV